MPSGADANGLKRPPSAQSPRKLAEIDHGHVTKLGRDTFSNENAARQKHSSYCCRRLRSRAKKRRSKAHGSASPTVLSDQVVLRRLAMAHLRLNLLSLMWERSEGDDFAILWAATANAARREL
jgi:hypothetical protein